MKQMRNPGLRRETIVILAVAVILAAVGFLIEPVTAPIMLLAGVVFCLLNILFSRKRYDEVRSLSQSIDRILHGQENVLISGSTEGELSILKSEIHKMTVRLSEQTELLKRDKIQLADSMADIFHQIRTPLTTINLIVSLLGEEEMDGERRLSLTKELRRQLERTEWLVETILKLSKLDAEAVSFNLRVTAARDLIDRAVQPLLIPMELRNQTLEVAVSDEKLHCDISWTAEALSNIVKNCSEHTPEGGRIAIRAEETALYTELSVTDSGPGFSKEDIPHLFERFYKGRNASEGSIGIGLALSRGIITAQNGTVSAANLPGGGAKFVIRFY